MAKKIRLSPQLRTFARTTIELAIAAKISLLWQLRRRESLPHTLPNRLTISLTSYPPRFKTLSLTLKSLLAQSTRPDDLYLWIADGDRDRLPADVVRLQSAGLVIRTCEDLLSYKKIIPALAGDSARFFVIADDDVYYPPHWLRELVVSYRPGQREVLCGRAHRMRFDSEEAPLPYAQWEWDIPAGEASSTVFPTGIGGVLYEPGIFHSDVTRVELFRELCPFADDVWLHWMASLNGARFRKVGPQRRMINWRNSQNVSLFAHNLTGNDAPVRNMVLRYGLPARRFERSS